MSQIRFTHRHYPDQTSIRGERGRERKREIEREREKERGREREREGERHKKKNEKENYMNHVFRKVGHRADRSPSCVFLIS